MIRSRLGLKALVLSGLILGLMAFAAAGAQAEGNFKVNGSAISSTLLPSIQVASVENKTASLLFTTGGGTKVEILCTEIKLLNLTGVEDAKLGVGGAVDLGKVHFNGCITKLNGVTSKNCEPHTKENKGLILTLAAKGLIRLHSSQPVIEVSPDTGTTFVVIELSELCAIGTEVPVAGVLFLQDCNNEGKVEKEEHLINELTALTKLTALKQPATLDGSALVKLTGKAHEGLKFSAEPV
jgi:hypothetical protein